MKFKRSTKRGLSLALMMSATLGLMMTFPAEARNWGDAFTSMNGQTEKAIPLVGSVLFLLGIVVGGIGVWKFKAHKDDPRNTPLSTPMWYLAAAVGLIFLPDMFDLTGHSLLGDSLHSQGSNGTGMVNIGTGGY